MDRLWLRDPYMGYYHKETIRLDKEKRHQEEIKKAEAKLEELRNKKV